MGVRRHALASANGDDHMDDVAGWQCAPIHQYGAWFATAKGSTFSPCGGIANDYPAFSFVYPLDYTRLARRQETCCTAPCTCLRVSAVRIQPSICEQTGALFTSHVPATRWQRARATDIGCIRRHSDKPGTKVSPTSSIYPISSIIVNGGTHGMREGCVVDRRHIAMRNSAKAWSSVIGDD